MSAGRDKKGERGTVLLTTLLITALIATVAIGLMNDLKFAIKRTINVNAYSQIDWYSRGAEDFARSYLTEIYGLLPSVAQNEALFQGEPILLPIDQGVIKISVSDGSHCFALNSLVNSAGLGDETARQQFVNLLTVLGYGQLDINRFADTIIDWIDKDTQTRSFGAEDGTYLGLETAYRTANTALSSVQELRALQGVDEILYQELRPFLCRGQAGKASKFNINSARAEHTAHLAAILGGPDQIETALRLIEERPAEGYDGPEGLLASPYLGGVWPEGGLVSTATSGEEGGLITYEPETLWMEVEITHGPAYRARSFAFDKTGKGLTYRGWGRESFRPQLPRPDDDAAEGETDITTP